MRVITAEWLARAADDLQPVISDVDMLDRLEAVYVEARYPGDLGLLPYGKPDKEEALAFYAAANAVVTQIRAGLEQATESAAEGE